MYIVITSKTTGLNFYLLQNLLITMLQALLLVFFHFLLIRGIIQILLFTLNAILLSSKLITLLQISMSYRVPSKLKSLQPNNIIRNLLMHNISPLLILKQITNSLSKLSSSELPSLQKKLSKKYLELHETISQPGTLLFTFYLPDFMYSVYPVFYVSMLKPATSNFFSKRTQLALIPVIIDSEPEYEIS